MGLMHRPLLCTIHISLPPSCSYTLGVQGYLSMREKSWCCGGSIFQMCWEALKYRGYVNYWDEVGRSDI